MAKVIRGKYPYKDDSKKSKKDKKREQKELQKKMLKKQDKQLKMQCNCNHLDSKKNKPHFKLSKDGLTRTCKICGGTMIADPKILEGNVESSVSTIYTVFSLARNKLNIDEETDRQITKTLQMVYRVPDLLKLIKGQSNGKKKNKNGKKNKNKKKNNSFNRLSY